MVAAAPCCCLHCAAGALAIVSHKIPPGYYFQYFALIVFSSSLLMSLQRLTSQLPTQDLKMARLAFLSASFQGIPHHFILGLAIIEGFHEGDNGILLGIGKSQVPHFFGIHVHGRLGQGPASDPFTGITVVADRQDIAGIVKMNDLLQAPEITVMAVDLYKVGRSVYRRCAESALCVRQTGPWTWPDSSFPWLENRPVPDLSRPHVPGYRPFAYRKDWPDCGNSEVVVGKIGKKWPFAFRSMTFRTLAFLVEQVKTQLFLFGEIVLPGQPCVKA